MQMYLMQFGCSLDGVKSIEKKVKSQVINKSKVRSEGQKLDEQIKNQIKQVKSKLYQQIKIQINGLEHRITD